MNKKDLAKGLKAARLIRGLSIRALADEIGISAMTLSRVEREITEPDQLTRNNIEKWLKTGKNQDLVRTPRIISHLSKQKQSPR